MLCAAFGYLRVVHNYFLFWSFFYLFALVVGDSVGASCFGFLPPLCYPRTRLSRVSVPLYCVANFFLARSFINEPNATLASGYQCF